MDRVIKEGQESSQVAWQNGKWVEQLKDSQAMWYREAQKYYNENLELQKKIKELGG